MSSQFRSPVLGCQSVVALACMDSRPHGVSRVHGGSACGPSTLWRSEVAVLVVRRPSHVVALWSLVHVALAGGGLDQKAAQRQTAELRSELERVRGAGAGGASSSRNAGGSPSLLEARLAGAVLRAEEAQRHLEERERDLRLTTEHAMDLQTQRDQYQGELQTTRAERDQLRVRAEAAEAQVAAATRELAPLRETRRRSSGCVRELLAQQTLARSLQQIVTDIGRSRSRSRSGASVSRVTGASVGQYLAGSSSRRRNEEEERHQQGEGSAQDGRGVARCYHLQIGERDPGRVAVDSEETYF
ncbi:hypothetical protein Taro_047276 [Colocasia esculenta]|uniref:Uncharacterized protein n=1 Tax=Colocasia esculenta TaxID=4460 RepID=A0A843X0N8_COLES|nr:hypothetical protein [Colocasia esculenta]